MEMEAIQDSNAAKLDKGDESPENNRGAQRASVKILRKSIVPALCIIVVVAGMFIGYSVLGKRPAADVFHWATWKHMYDLVFAG